MIDSTSKKQSEKLLKLGLPAESADMFIGSDGASHSLEDFSTFTNRNETVFQEPQNHQDQMV